MPEAFGFTNDPVTVHAFNKARSEVAVSLNNHEVKIYEKTGLTYKNTATLGEHGQRVTGIDWAPLSNRIVTCGADRNAYVWTYEGGKWKPHLVILRINRAATCVHWSPKENKFAVGSGARVISICYFEEQHNWWVSKHIKKPIRSTVTCLDWHPNNVLIAAGSTDFKARVFSAYVKEVEEKPSATSWGNKMPFQSLMAEYSNGGGGWVHGVSFSPSGDKLAWVGHDASVSVAIAGSGDKIAFIKGKFLPFMDISWVSENSMVAVGHDCGPKLFSQDDSGNLSFISDLDVKTEKAEMKVSAMNMFKSMAAKGTAGDEGSGELKTAHQNTVTQVSIFQGDKANCSKFSTSGVDGQLIIWDVKSLEKSISGLKIA